MNKILILMLSLASFFSIADEAPITPTKSGMYDVGGFKLYLECFENDKPILILEQGFGRSGSDGVWLNNIARLQSDFSICLYDRSGLGKSEKGPVPFTVNDMASRLHTLLEKAEVKPPYYFAGGSYAIYIISAFNNLYSDEVLGAAFIDPSPIGYFHTMGTRWPANFSSDNQELMGYMQFEQSVHDPMFKRVPENVDHMQSYQQLNHAKNFGHKPVIVVRAADKGERYDPPFVPGEIAKKMDELFAGADAQFKSLSTHSKVVYSTSTRHHLHITDPDLVVKSIEQLLDSSAPH
ncbi:alpha/beta fold hydrolase [Neptunicella marina]|uniref:Alpha/beta hydrolase n=1 Tax=Neptunicella marina TaxID=2125989 RepID=A0A8J6IXK3_9ALTE|nr:alpha/beta hydrolase [Neptunicella marina]MBC3767118.1 alpha/beta hydrolase [Neptunicella marina]